MIAWIDAGAGAAGDMLLGALLDLGVPLEVVQDAVDAVSPEPARLRVEKVERGGLAATRCHVDVPDSHTHRHWSTIRTRLTDAALHPEVRDLAMAAFGRLAETEGAVHGIDPEAVHFHEVGALDAIADVVGACAGFHHLGLAEVVVSPVAVGSGRIEGAAHGSLPVPPPAVVELLAGAPSLAGPGSGETCTPTGAALLRAVATAFGPQPAMVVDRHGSGAGSRDPATHANVVRILVGEPVAAPDALPLLLETNVDDLDPRLWPVVLQELFDAGASDAWLTPIVMKKGRPAHTLAALVSDEAADQVRTAMFRHSTTLGLRGTRVEKTATEHSFVTVVVDGHDVAVKVARHAGRVVNVQPEYEDVARVARTCGAPVKQVLAEAVAQSRSA